MIRLYVKIPAEFMCLILQDRFWFVQILFVRKVKLKFLAPFPVDHFTHPVVSCLILFLGLLAVFAYYVIDGFVSITP